MENLYFSPPLFLSVQVSNSAFLLLHPYFPTKDTYNSNLLETRRVSMQAFNSYNPRFKWVLGLYET